MSIKIRVSDLNENQMKDIKGQLCLIPKNSSFGYNRTKIDNIINFYYIDTEDGSILIPFYYGSRLFGSQIKDYPILQDNKTSLNVKWRYWQPPIIKKVVEHLKTKRCCILAVPPGTGKTAIATATSYQANMLTLVLLPDRPIIKQWAKTIGWMTNLGFIVDKDARKILNKETIEKSKRNPLGYIISTHGRYHEIPKELLNRVGTLIVDEAHGMCVPGAIEAILCTIPKYVILCTATPYRSNKMEKMLYLLAGEDLVDNAPLKPYIVKVIHTLWIFKETLQPFIISGGTKRMVPNFQKLESTMQNSERVIYFYAFLLFQLWKMGRKSIAFCREKQLIEKLIVFLRKKNIPFSTFYSKQEKFEETPILLATIAKCGRGFDEDNYCESFSGRRINTIVLLSSIKFSGLLFQVIGRGMRDDDPWVIDIVHGNKTYLNQHEERIKLYKRTNGKIENMEMDQKLKEKINKIPL